jgi:hypothetical protein
MDEVNVQMPEVMGLYHNSGASYSAKSFGCAMRMQKIVSIAAKPSPHFDESITVGRAARFSTPSVPF